MRNARMGLLCWVIGAGTGCAAGPGVDGEPRPPAPRLNRVASIDGFEGPETVCYDERRDVFYVSNMVGNATERDGNGFLSRIDAARPTQVDVLVRGSASVELHGPKGLVLEGDTLWVADIDAVRGFDVRTGGPVHTYDLRPHDARSLNDIALHPDGSLYVTDPRLVFHDDAPTTHEGLDRVYRIAPGGAVEVALMGGELAQPNGIAWDGGRAQLLVAPLESDRVLAWRPGAVAPIVAGRAAGAFDGLEILSDGSLLVSCLEAGTIEHIARDGSATIWLDGLELPGNFGIDTRRGRLAIPLIAAGRVELWAWSAGGR